MKIWLLYDRQGHGSFDTVGPGRTVNSVTDLSPVLVTTPCQTGWWKLRIQGTETGAAAEQEVRGASEVVRVDC